MSDRALVCGAGGFVGGAMVRLLKSHGFKVRAASSRPIDKWLYVDPEIENAQVDLRNPKECQYVVRDCKWVYNFAAKVGGIGFIQENKLECLLSSLINTNLLYSLPSDVAGYFFASSACVYGSSEHPISEWDPLDPSAGYGDEKVFSEKMCRAFHEERGVPVHIARFTGIYGPGDSNKGRENKDHVPSALARKVVRAKLTGQHEINIWGDGNQIRDFLYVDDCAEAAFRIMNSNVFIPVNVSNQEPVTVNRLVDILEQIAAIKLQRFHDLKAPEGVRFRVLSAQRMFDVLRWVPPTQLVDGMRATYNEIYSNAVCYKQ